jgi:hypothetical protein
VLWTARSDLAHFPEFPTISYTTGHVTFVVGFVDGDLQTTSYSRGGGARQTDVCEVLAS